jgi:hypothetical protein
MNGLAYLVLLGREDYAGDEVRDVGLDPLCKLVGVEESHALEGERVEGDSRGEVVL